jgi:riboflavin synthase
VVNDADGRAETQAMFTGLIADVGSVGAIELGGTGARLRIATRLADELREGDSIAVDGVCLTATDVRDGSCSATRR